ncbi:MAG: outer membrane beta-barrel protein, partial [Candidatus Binatia bacterium]
SQASIMMGVVNGWDNVVDSNDGKSVIGSVGITPVEQFALAINGIYGAEQPDRGDSKRGVADIVATIKPVENFAIILNYDYGNESDLEVGGHAEWNAFSGILSVDVPDVLPVPIGFALRGEYFDDSDGVRLPTPGGDGFGGYQNAWEVTGTVKVVLAEGLMFRTEYRYDASHHSIFEKRLVGDDDTRPDQQTIAAELSYVF